MDEYDVYLDDLDDERLAGEEEPDTCDYCHEVWWMCTCDDDFDE